MQKEDIQWAVLGILILLVIALVIKPMATGEPVNLGLPQSSSAAEENETLIETATPLTIPKTVIITPVATPTPTPTPVWNNVVQTVGFVDPSTYGENLVEPIPNSTKINSSQAAIRSTSMTTFATISGKYSGATQVVNVPFPYWELWYSVDPITTYINDGGSGTMAEVTSVKGVAVNAPKRSYSSLMPEITIQVIDASDPNRIVRTISPAGGIDPTLWKDSGNANITGTYSDPRPWKEKFYEGQRSYYFVVKTSLISSYTIDIRVPTSYVGKY